MTDDVDVDDMRETMRRVAVYRAVCEGIRATARGTIINALVWLGLSIFLFKLTGFFVVIHVVLGVVELLIGLVKRFKPSLECVLLDGLMLVMFGVVFGYRQVDAWMRFGQINPFVIFSVMWIFGGIGQVNKYFALRRAIGVRPSGAQLRYVDELVREIRDADPVTDPVALDLDTSPRVKAKLLGDLAFFVETRSGAVTVSGRDDVDLERRETARGPVGYLRVDGEGFPKFPLTAENWANYARWKTEGGTPPPPVTVLPAGGGA